MKRTKVVIASILKPIDDTRMLEKFGLSMAETNKYDINIIGFESKNTPSHERIHFHPIKSFPRLSWARLRAPWKVYKSLIKVKPEVIIVNTHELLIVTSLYKILFGGKFYYDLRENYWKNILNTHVYPSYVRPFIATWVRLKEWFSKPFVHHYILAEKIYEKQLPFIGKRYTIVENKYAPHLQQQTAYHNPDPGQINLVFSGTLSSENGLFEAIELSKELYKIDKKIRLRIVGYCALRTELEQLHESIRDFEFIELNGGDHLVPHSEIIEAIEKADFGFVFKRMNNGTNDEKLLTRIFEYTANQLPILLIDNPHWISYCNQFNAALVVKKNMLPEQILESMTSMKFYDKGDTRTSLWASEEKAFLSIFY